MVPRLILFGVGNPGRRYRSTRHNVGLMALEALAARHGARWRSGCKTYDWAETTVGETAVTLVLPKSYVNLSGQAVGDYRSTDDVEPGEFLVLVDDIALPFGQLRLRRRGSDGGHNGLRSIIDELGTSEFPRLRMGVGPVPADVDPADFVLEPLSRAEGALAAALVERAVACVEDLFSGGFDRTMSLYNAGDPAPESD